MKMAGVAALALSFLGSAPVLADSQTIDVREFRIFYVQPEYGDVVPSPVKFEITFTGGYKVDRDLACSPAGSCYGQFPDLRLDDTGHCHTYVENMAEPGELAAFSAACETTFYLDLEPGDYCAYADLTHNDHVARFKPGPQDFPGFDKVCFRVRPGNSPPGR